jgi:thiol-disulfide isomerase/thioredoxin
MIVLFIVVLIGISVYYYMYYVNSPKSSTAYKPNHEQVPIGSGSGGSGNTAELLFFYADWCPHCKTAKPIWYSLQSEYQNKTINGYTVTFTEINCSEETAEVDKMMNQYNVEGYPTIKLLKDGQVIEYDAKPNKETLTQFLNTVL